VILTEERRDHPRRHHADGVDRSDLIDSLARRLGGRLARGGFEGGPVAEPRRKRCAGL
jgi:hypothetical protein